MYAKKTFQFDFQVLLNMMGKERPINFLFNFLCFLTRGRAQGLKNSKDSPYSSSRIKLIRQFCAFCQEQEWYIGVCFR